MTHSGDPIHGHGVTAESFNAELLGIARDLAARAGALMLERRAAGLSVSTKSSSTDVVTDADRAVEQLIVTELARIRPDDAVVAEEGSGHAGRTGAVEWVVDPIDGTVNFLLGYPQFAVSIAARVEGRVVAGCVRNPSSGDEFEALLGGGATRNGIRLTGPRAIALPEAVVATGFGYDRARRAEQGAVAAGLLGRVANLRRSGSAALDLCALAAGWVDAYYERGLNDWDFAAGLLIAEEAGAATAGLDGAPAGARMVAAAHPDLAPDFFALLDELHVP